ncbi:hypothetical protein P4O66_000867, partial [Electrophorus voltai]
MCTAFELPTGHESWTHRGATLHTTSLLPSGRLAEETPNLQEYLEKENIEKKLLSQTSEELLLWPVARLECLRCEKEELDNSLLEQLKELRLQKQKELQVLQEMLKHKQQEETELLQKQQEEEEHNRSIKTVMILALADMKMACEQEKKSLKEELEKLRLSLQPIEQDMSLKVALEMKNQEIKDQHDLLVKLYTLRLAEETPNLQEYLEKENIEKKLLSQTSEELLLWPVARLECLRCEKEELDNSLLEQLKELRLQKQKELQVLQEMLKHKQQEETELLQKQQEEEEHNRSIKTVMILALADMKMACEQEKKSLKEELEKLRLSLQPIEQDMSLKVALEMKNQEIKDQHDLLPIEQDMSLKVALEMKNQEIKDQHDLLCGLWPDWRGLRCEKEELDNSLLEQLKGLRLQKQKELQVLQEMLKHKQQEETELLQKQQEEEEHNRAIKIMILALADMKMACEQEKKSLKEELEKLRLSLQPIEQDMSLKVALEMKNQEIKDQHDLLISLWKDTEEDRGKMRRFWSWCAGRIEDEYTDTKDVEVWPVARLECLRCEKEELDNSLLEQLKELRLQKQKELQVLQEMLKHKQQEETELLQKQQEEEEHNRSIKTVMILALADMKMACEQEKKSLKEELEKLRLSLQPIEQDMSLKVALEMKNQEIKDQHDLLVKLYT